MMRSSYTAVLAALALAAAVPAALAQSAQQDQQYFREIAQQQASNGQVKEYAEHRVRDHGEKMQAQGAKGEQFDRAYLSQMVKDHEKALNLVRSFSDRASAGASGR
jgi:predicted outer membrane protein